MQKEENDDQIDALEGDGESLRKYMEENPHGNADARLDYSAYRSTARLFGTTASVLLINGMSFGARIFSI